MERNPSTPVRVRAASWVRDESALSSLRHQVFVAEQGVPLDVELDGRDADCRHVLALADDGRPIGTARMNASGHIGRVAVAKAWRRRGVGTRLVRALVDEARRAGLREVDLDSQVSAVAFYRALGFRARGAVFLEAGIEHRNMRLTL